MILMVEGKYKPFMVSASYKKLYGNEDSYKVFIHSNRANQDLILSRVMAFYNGRKK